MGRRRDTARPTNDFMNVGAADPSSDDPVRNAVRPSMPGVGHRSFLLIDEGAQRLVDAGIDRWRLIGGKRLLPGLVGALRRIELAFRLPLLDRIVVGE